MTDDIYVGAIGVTFRLDTGVDLTGATKLEIKVKKPVSGATSWTATQYGTTNYIQYTTTAAGDLEAGEMLMQAYVEWGDTSKHYGLTVVQKVRALWEVVDA